MADSKQTIRLSRRGRLKASSHRAALLLSAVAATTLAMKRNAVAASLFWDPGQTGGNSGGGSGNWDTTDHFWHSPAGDGAWPNTIGSNANFGGTAPGNGTLYTVTLSSGIVVGTITFNTSGYLLSSGSIKNGSSAWSIAGPGTDEIDSRLIGTGNLTYSGSGNLTLGGGDSGTPSTAGSFISSGGGIANIGGYFNIGNSISTGQSFDIKSSSTVNWTGTGTATVQNFGVGDTSAGTLNVNSGTLTVSAANFFVGNGTTTGNLTIGGGNLTVSSGAIYIGAGSSGSGTGTGTLTITSGSFSAGTSPIYLGGPTSSDTGTVQLNGGTLSSNTAIGSGGASVSTFNFNGGTLQASGNNLALSGITTANVENNGAIIDTHVYNITIAQNLVHSTIAGDNATDGGLTKNGSGSLTLAGNNSFNGPTVINAGTLITGSPNALAGSTLNYNNQGGTLSFGTQTAVTIGGISGSQNLAITNASSQPVNLTVGNNGATTAYSGVLSGNGSLTLAAGQLTLSAASTYQGGTTVSNAGLELDFTQLGSPVSNILPSAGVVTLGNRSQLTTNGSSSNEQQLGNTILNGAAEISSTSVTLNLGMLTRNTGGCVDFETGGANTLKTGSQNTANTILGGWATCEGGWATVANSTIQTLASSAYTSNYAAATAASDFDATSSGTFATNVVNSLRVSNTNYAAVGLNGAFTVKSGGILLAADGFSTNICSISGGTSLTSGNGADLIVNNLSYNTILNIATPIVGTGIGLTINGGRYNRPTYLTAGNTYTGPTIINGGSLWIGHGDTIGSIAASSAILDSGALVLDRADALVFANPISGVGGVAMYGTGTAILTGQNSYSGGTDIEGGTVQANNSVSALGSGVTQFTSGTLAGTGNTGGAVYFGQLGVITAGTGSTTSDSAGALTAGPTTFGDSIYGGGAYTVKLINPHGTAGTSGGWDQLVLTSLSVTTTSSSPFTINLSDGLGSTHTPLVNGQSFVILTTTGEDDSAALTADIHAGDFALNTSAFDGGEYAASAFTLTDISTGLTSSELILTYGTTPEPSTLLLTILGFAGMVLPRRRTRKRIPSN